MTAFSSRRGTVVLVALCLTAVIGIALATYLGLCQHSLRASTRSLYLAQASRLAESGFEEAVWNLSTARKNTASVAATAWSGWNFTDAIDATESYGSNSDQTTCQLFREAGIDADDDDVGAGTDTTNDDCTKTFSYALGNGATGQVAVAITNYQSTSVLNPPIIRLVAKVTLSSGQSFIRKFRAKTKRAPLFANAIASANSYVLFANRGTVDSWNSDTGGTGTYTANYSFTATTASNCAAVLAGSTGVSIDETHVYGYLTTNDANCTWDTAGVILGWVKGPSTPGATNVDSTRLGKSAFIPLYDIITPTGAATVTLSDSNDSATYGTGATAASPLLMEAEDLYLTGSDNLVIDGHVRIRINHDFAITAGGKLTVTSSGSLQIFVGNSCWIYDGGIVTPANNDPRKVALFCTSSNSSAGVFVDTGTTFRGVIYSAKRYVRIDGSGTFYGAILANNYVSFADTAATINFHYDLNLRNAVLSGVDIPVMLDTITEL